MSRFLKLILALNLIVLALLTFAYPHLMVSPGKLIAGHKLLETDCFACHAPLTGASAARCVACHKTADIGRLTTAGVAIVKPRTATPFHQQLISQDCMACHKKPNDSLHQQIAGNCLQCHTQQKWTPASFDHNKYFALDGDHNAACVTCHVRNDYSRYSCYGCHEHTLTNIRRKHIEEAVSKFDNCVECHRSANKHDIKGGKSEGDGERRAGHKEKD